MANYQVIMSHKTLKKIDKYKSELSSNSIQAGRKLKNALKGKDVKKMSIANFISVLLNTKKPRIFAESKSSVEGKWNKEELSILGDINIAAEVDIYDNGIWASQDATVHNESFRGELLFTPGALLEEHSPDYEEVVENNQINTENYNALVERRLLPIFLHASQKAQENNNKAVIALPGVGCGVFSGNFLNTINQTFQAAVQKMLEKHKDSLSGIGLVQMEGHKEFAGNDVGDIHFKMDEERKGLLNKPEKWGENYKNYKFFKVVAWDHVSWPGNDFYRDNNRDTDDGVSLAATNGAECFIGVKGQYDEKQKKFVNSVECKDWETVIKDNNIRLESYEIKIEKDGKLNSIAPPSVILDIKQEKIRQLYAGGISNLWNRNKNQQLFVEDLKNILNDAVDQKIILDKTQKEDLKTQINSDTTLESLFSEYKADLNRKNFLKRVINWLCEVFGGGLAAEFAERTASNNEFRNLINNQRGQLHQH